VSNGLFKKKTEQHAAQAPALRERSYPSKFDSAAIDRLRPRARRGESFDPESFDPELTTEGLVADCGSLVFK
jgi:hypothetical protein